MSRLRRAFVILSESASRRLFPDGDAIGKRVDFGDSKNLEIVGVVNSASLWMAQSREPLAAYLAVLQMPAYNTLFVDLRTAGGSSGRAAGGAAGFSNPWGATSCCARTRSSSVPTGRW